MAKVPPRISETVYTDHGLRLPLAVRLRAARWPWVVLLAAPLAGVALAGLWHWLVR